MVKLKHHEPIQFPWVVALTAGAVMLSAWLGSDDQPEGCYRIDKDTHLAVADGKVRLSGKHEGEARIVAVNRVRGWVVTLDRALSYDPAHPSGAQFVHGKPGSRRRSLFIDERFGKHPGILYHPDKGADVRFPEIDCDTLPQGG